MLICLVLVTQPAQAQTGRRDVGEPLYDTPRIQDSRGSHYNRAPMRFSDPHVHWQQPPRPRPGDGRSDYRRPDYGRSGYGRPDDGRSGGRSDHEQSDQARSDRERPGDRRPVRHMAYGPPRQAAVEQESTPLEAEAVPTPVAEESMAAVPPMLPDIPEYVPRYHRGGYHDGGYHDGGYYDGGYHDGGYHDGDPSCGPSCGCRGRGWFNPGGLWVRGEYLLWWVDGFDTPPLVTTSPDTTDRTMAGVLGQPTTRVLFGGTDLADGARSGGRISFGKWLDPCETVGIEASYFGLGTEESTFHAVSPGSPILARPFFNVEPGFEGQDAELIAYPDLLEGNVTVRGSTELQGFEVLFRRAACRSCWYKFDVLAGYRYNRLEDELTVWDFKTVLSGDAGLAIGTTLEEHDHFETLNRFHGGEIGCVAEVRGCRWSLEFLTKLALGNSNSRVSIRGNTVSTTPVAGGNVEVVETPAGLLAQQTNIGVYEDDDFAVIPEIGVTLGWDINCRLRATFGYTFMYWSRVARPGDQVDTELNLSQLTEGGLVGAPHPQFPWVVTDMWAQGLNFGLDFRY